MREERSRGYFSVVGMGMFSTERMRLSGGTMCWVTLVILGMLVKVISRKRSRFYYGIAITIPTEGNCSFPWTTDPFWYLWLSLAMTENQESL
jgi:hypothetical protein